MSLQLARSNLNTLAARSTNIMALGNRGKTRDILDNLPTE